MPVILHLSRTLIAEPVLKGFPGLDLRHYRDSADIDPWLRLRERAFARQPVGVGQWLPGDFQREFLRKAWWSNERMWLAEVSGDLIGAVALADRVRGEVVLPAVHWLLVDPRWRRRGVGRTLMSALELACWKLGRPQIWLETHAGWASAAAFYHSLGYRQGSCHSG